MKELDRDSVNYEYIVNKSKFISFAVACNSFDQLKDMINGLWKNQYRDASHIVYALRLINQGRIDYYFSDDGEPSGTAGKPLLNLLETQDIINAGVIVVRYYGGINLGTGGLVRAYIKAAQMPLSNLSLKEYIEYNNYKISIQYNMLEYITKVIYNLNGIVLSKDFSENIILNFQIPVKNIAQFEDNLTLKKVIFL